MVRAYAGSSGCNSDPHPGQDYHRRSHSHLHPLRDNGDTQFTSHARLGKPEDPEKTYTDMGRTCRLRTTEPRARSQFGGVVCFSHQCYYRMKLHYLSTCCIGAIGSLVRSKNRKVKAALCFQWNVDNNRNIRPRAVWGEMKGDMIKVGHRIKRRWTVLRQFGEKKVKTKSQIFRSGKPWVLMVD